MLATMVQIDGWDPVAGAAVVLRASSLDDPAVCHLNGRTWWPMVAKLPTLRYDLFDGAFAGQIAAPSSTLTLQGEAWPDCGRYMLADARFRLWTGPLGAAWSGYTLRFDGRVSGQPQLVDGKADIGFAVDDRWLDVALLATYAGTTGSEGPIELKGQVKPLALGAPRYVAGTLIDSIDSVFQVSGYGAVQGFDAALEKLARFGAPVADYASYAALVAAALPAGTWATARSVGMARFGAPPAGQISFLLRGDAAGSDGWARKPGQLIRRIAQLSGGTGKIDDASLDALDVARPYNLSVDLDQQTTARDLIQKIAASVNAVAGVSWTGQLFVVPVAIGAPTVTLAADGSSLPPVGSVRQIEIDAPYRKLAIGAERAWTVHALGDIAFEAPLIDRGAYDPATTYREGNIVSLGDGSRWLFQNTSPLKGNAPAADNPAWAALSGAVQADWSQVTGDGKPADNADVTGDNTSKDTRAVQGRPGADVLSGIDTNIDGILAQALRQDDLVQVFDARTLVEGQPVGTRFLAFRNQASDPVTGFASASDFSGVFTKVANGTGYTMNLQSVKAGNATFADVLSSYDRNISDLGQASANLNQGLNNLGGTVGTLSRNLQTTAADAGAAKASITDFKQAYASPTGLGFAKALVSVDVNGRLTGYSATSDGHEGVFHIVADRFVISAPGDAAGVSPFSVQNGVVKATNFEADIITYGSLVAKFTDVGMQLLDPNGGYLTIPGGPVLQWGRYRQTIQLEQAFSITFLKPFPTACFVVIPVGRIASADSYKDLWLQNVGDPTTTGATFFAQAATSNNRTLDGFDWVAVGK